MSRLLRQHRTALLALAVVHFVFFFPVLFLGRVVSPNDVFRNFSPWNMGRPLDAVRAQNSLLNDPPTAYYPLFDLAKSDSATFHWNPYIAGGVAGFGSSASAAMTPFVLLPLMLPLPWIYTAMIFLKLNVAFLCAYGWLREERLGRRGAAIGAAVFALSGIYSVRWLWQITNATAFYPALLWILRRTATGRRTPVILTALVALFFATSGFPAAVAYAAWLAAAYAIYLAVQQRRVIIRPVVFAAAGVVIAVLLALPFVIPFVQFLGRSGYLEIREGISLSGVYPLEHWRAFFQPDLLGNAAYRNWTGNAKLGVLNNYVEATLYLGILAIPLALVGLFNRRARARGFWLAAAALIIACMFGVPSISGVVADLPGFKYSALSRVALLLPLPISYLAAAARLRKQLLYDAVAILVAFDLALFAGRFHPYLTYSEASVPATETVTFLQSEARPFRIAPMMDYLWPNTAELIRVEDVRSHFSSEADYRKLLQRIDPSSWSGHSTVITFFSPKYNFDDPLNGLLGVRFFVEHKYIDIIKWGIFKATLPGVKETGTLALRPGTLFERTIRVDAEPFWSIELPMNIESGNGRVDVTLLKGGSPVWHRAFTADEVNVMNKIYIPLRPYARLGETVSLRVRAGWVKGYVLQGEDKQSVFYGRVTTPVMFDRELPEGRLFRNLSEVPRFRAVSKLRKLSDDAFLATRDIDFATEAVITDAAAIPFTLPPSHSRLTLERYGTAHQRIRTESDAPFFLATTEKLTPELAITIDGRPERPIDTDLVFAGVPVPAGRHEVVFTRRVGRGWWWGPVVGLVLLLATMLIERRNVGRASARLPRSTG